MFQNKHKIKENRDRFIGVQNSAQAFIKSWESSIISLRLICSFENSTELYEIS